MRSDFMVKTAKIIAEIRDRTCIDDDDVKVIKEILQDAFKVYYDELHECSDDAYNEGYSDGYSEGYYDGTY